MSETRIGQCPVCDRSLRLPVTAAGKKVKCAGCASILRIAAGDGDAFELTVEPGAGEATAAREQDGAAAGVPACPQCHETTAPGDTFCLHCGANLAAAAEPPPLPAREAPSRRRRGDHARAHNQRRVVSAARILLVLAVVFGLFGTVAGFLARGQAQKAKEQIEVLVDAEVLDVGGEAMTVAELRRQIDLEVVLVFGANYLLALIMLGLYFWAQKSPFPAALTGLCVYLVVVVLNAVLEPTTLVQGIVVKVFIVLGLLGGMQAALAERSAGRVRRLGHRGATSGAGTGRARRARAR